MTYPSGSENIPQPPVPPHPADVTAQAVPVAALPEHPAAVPMPVAAPLPPPAPTTAFLPAPPVAAPPTVYLPAIAGTPQEFGTPTVVPGAVTPPAPSALRRNMVPVLSLVSGFLVLLSGIAIGLYINERGELKDTRTTLQAEVQEQREIVTQRDTKIAEAEKRLGELTTNLSVSQTSLETVTAERDALLPCMRRVQELYAALEARSDLNAIYDQTEAACDKAEETINP